MNLFWFRNDLRLADNPAFYEATKRGSVIAVYVHDDITPGAWKTKGASRWWLYHSLQSLKADIEAAGGYLHIYKGEAKTILPEIARQAQVKAVYWNRQYEPHALKEENFLIKSFRELGIDVRVYNGGLLYDPEQIKNKQGGYFKVFTPFWKTCLQEHIEQPLGTANGSALLASTALKIKETNLTELNLLPIGYNWATKLEGLWQQGEQAGMRQLGLFISNKLNRYATDRDYPQEDGTSSLSAHLHFGEISPRQIWHEVQKYKQETKDTLNTDKFLSELGWREFAHYLLYHHPALPEEPFQKQFMHFPWQEDPQSLESWQRGETGYPLIDAGMRELWATGYMHNRVRMAVASFLTKHLLIHWKKGAEWFWETLVDADLANNTCGWQWVAGCGADAAPYFRIFNPITQSEKFDPQGNYIKHWVPELRDLPERAIHKPWEYTDIIGKQYPMRIVDHKNARERALDLYHSIKR